MINLAPLRYLNILKSRGGPIEKLTYRQRLMPDGQLWYEVHSYFAPERKIRKIEHQPALYATTAGAGSAPFLHSAKFKAISESLERWAFETLVDSPEHATHYGFDVEPSTTGLAAFPGIFPSSARRFAMNEAIERWSLAAFWEEKLNILPLGRIGRSAEINSFRVITPFERAHLILLHKPLTNLGLHCYGFAADSTLSAATQRASVELLRNETVLRAFEERARIDPRAEASVQMTWERRVLYFARDLGFMEFSEKLQKAVSRSSLTCKKPRVLVDTRVRGPWEKYAWVWRCLLEPISNRERSEFAYFVF